VEIEAVAEDIGDMLCDTVDSSVVRVQRVQEVKVSRIEHVFP
jgi:hypothetical protein